MEYKNLSFFVLIILLVGLIAGVGVLVLDRFGSTVTDTTTVTEESITITSQTGSTTYADQGVTSVSWIGNSTLNCSLNSNPECGNFTSAGVITLNATFHDGSTMNVTYVYEANSSTTDSAHFSRDAVADIPEDWMSLIVTIGILAIILGLVLASFSMYQKR